MRAIGLREFGGPEKFEIMELPIPAPTAGTVLIRNRVVGIHYSDVRQREGSGFFGNAPLPAVIGFQVAGTIEAIGEGVKGLRPGMRVAASLMPKASDFGKRSRGGYAECSIADVDNVWVLPERVSFEQSMAYLGITSSKVLYDHFQPVAPDATVLIHGAAGNLGIALIQIAKQAGNKVIALLRRGEQRAEFCLESGADHVVLISREGWVDEVRALTGGRGADVSFNAVGGDTIEQDIDALAYRGKIIVTALAQGWPRNEAWIGKAVMSCTTIQMTRSADLLREGPVAEKARAYRDDFMRTAKLNWRIAAYRLEDAAKAHRDMEAGNTLGKIILTVD
jgi:NADPH:quinone reductase